ncbi:OLC1v1008923C3 [Oldenlandia corymbosa var. corymbosa]|uniref:OLC1v1008923C3 n=1 Tax=Oldenlandia corymbosa var. corymbosa TaxID=529605 RepID=A0AAV1DP85_OLDCO|nr:OLC1v1008923C3 [Oldenlandia corymbosa var. corymbosa]
MPLPVPVNVLSDDEEDAANRLVAGNNDPKSPVPHFRDEPICIDLCTPYSSSSKRRKKKPRLSDPASSKPSSGSTDFPLLVIDDDDATSYTPSTETPSPPPLSTRIVSVAKCSGSSLGVSPTPSVVEETPLSEMSKHVPIIRSNRPVPDLQPLISDHLSPGVSLTPSVVEETPLSEMTNLEVPNIICNRSVPTFQPLLPGHLSPDRLINLVSDSESDKGSQGHKSDEGALFTSHASKGLVYNSKFVESTLSFGENDQRNIPETSSLSSSLEHHSSQVYASSNVECDLSFHRDKVSDLECKRKEKVFSEKGIDDPVVKERMSKEERLRMKEEKKLQREQEKLRKAAEKAEAAEVRKLQKEKQKWEKGKFAQKSIVAHIDNKVVEMGSVGGHLLTRFGEKGLSFRVASNPIASSIIWSMNIPEELSQISSERNVILYVLLIYGAEEFCNIITSGALSGLVSEVQHQYPNHTICFLVNRLMAYVNKREQSQYKNPGKDDGWARPPIEEIIAKLATHYVGVHSRLCTDEAELAEHVVSLTQSLASCQYRKKLTPLSVNANGSLVPRDCADRDLIKKDIWLVFLNYLLKYNASLKVST